MTVKEVYRLALDLLLVREADAKELEAHVPGLVNIMLEELRCVDASITGLDRGPVRVKTLSDDVPLEPEIVAGVLPYGLAARLEADEDRAKASWLLAEYMEKIRLMKKLRPGAIADCY